MSSSFSIFMRCFGVEASECVPSSFALVDGFLSAQPPNFCKTLICASVHPNSSGDSLVVGFWVSGDDELSTTTRQSSGTCTGTILNTCLKIERITLNNDRIHHNKTLKDK